MPAAFKGSFMDWKAMVQRAFKLCGFELHRTLPGTEYVQCTPYGYSTYAPWFEDGFQQCYRHIKGHTAVTEDRCYILQALCKHALHLDGHMAECGVYRGGTAFLLASTLRAQANGRIALHLFDTFAGMPASANDDLSDHKQGDFGDTSLQAVQAYLREFPAVSFHPGAIPDTFSQVDVMRFSFVHIDVDLYQSAKDCCEFFYPRMVQGGIMIFDDYGFPHYRDAERRAVDEFFGAQIETPIVLRTGQCLVMKL